MAMIRAKRLLFRALALSVILPLFSMLSYGCSEQTTRSEPGSDDGRLLVGFSMATFKEDRWLQDRERFAAKAQQVGFDVIVTNANQDSELQYKQVADLVQKGIDVLVFVPQDYATAYECTNLAKKAGIPVISYDRLVAKGNVDAYISFDNVKVGKLQGEALSKAVPEGGYIILNGSPDDHNSEMFHKGYLEALQSSIDSGKISIVAETWVQNWTREKAFSFVSTVLKKSPDMIDGILAGNDSLAWGAIDALSEARLAKKVTVVGHDADLAACQRIVDGTQLMTVYKPIKSLVEKTAEVCKILAEGKKPDTDKTINDGTYDVPYIMIDCIPVTRENMDETVIKDGFHLKEDVYRTFSESSNIS